MFFDHIVIGSGLSALATSLGLSEHSRRICIIGGGAKGFRYYPGTKVPATFVGVGGLGQYWHGVIPLSFHHRPFGVDEGSWDRLAEYFYPRSNLQQYMGSNKYFVPCDPIRPAEAFTPLVKSHLVDFAHDSALRVSLGSDGNSAIVLTEAGYRVEGRHVWFAAGALNTPALLARSGLIGTGPRSLSDHVIGYAGRMAATAEVREMMSAVCRHRGGVLFPFRFGNGRDHLVTLRPARFDFAKLDSGIAKRAVFGLPASRVVAGIAGNLSPGLVAEAAFNKFGLFAQSAYYSVYVQTVASNAWWLDESGDLHVSHGSCASDALRGARATLPFGSVELSRQTDLYLPGIHLHGSLTVEETNLFGVGRVFKNLHVVDASGLQSIGPEHHSFAMMAAGYARAITIAKEE